MVTQEPDPERLARFGARVVQDAVAEATEAYWLRRAAAFDAVGTTRGDLIALNCRRHATIASVDVAAELETETLAVIDEFWQRVDPSGAGRARIAIHRAGGAA